MGTRNSSKTRVVPVFDRIFASDPSGAGWLPGLMRLGSRSSEALRESVAPRLVEGHRPTWGNAEMSLPAPLSLLEHLVVTITGEQVASSGDKGNVLAKRQALA